MTLWIELEIIKNVHEVFDWGQSRSCWGGDEKTAFSLGL